SSQRTLEDFIAEVRARPGAINYGTAGTGSSSHLAGALFDSLAAARMVPVAYRGGLPSLNNLLAGQIQAVFAPILEVTPQIQAGTMRALGVT
ncbi:tripartite tricarboxylate transporter substrate-binding protein, partial [Clostridium perfringens]